MKQGRPAAGSQPQSGKQRRLKTNYLRVNRICTGEPESWTRQDCLHIFQNPQLREQYGKAAWQQLGSLLGYSSLGT